jgi:hypothetical protein
VLAVLIILIQNVRLLDPSVSENVEMRRRSGPS